MMKILVCIDGETHSSGAVRQAILLGLSLPAEVIALHVIDPWLKKFYNELYSQGRKRYLEYVDECLQAEADRVREEFEQMCLAEGLDATFRVRRGEPLTEILEEVRRVSPNLLITGNKPLNAWGRFRSGDLPGRLEKQVDTKVSMISINGGSISQ